MREYFENEICANCCIDKQFCDRCGVRKKTANSEKEKPALMDRLYESDRNCDGNCKNCVAICGMTQNTIFLEAADAIEELLAKVPTWISVKERLPEINQPVLICAFGRSVGEGTYYGHDGVHHVWKMYCVAGTYWDDEVTHWMPLPEPPKGVE